MKSVLDDRILICDGHEIEDEMIRLDPSYPTVGFRFAAQNSRRTCSYQHGLLGCSIREITDNYNRLGHHEVIFHPVTLLGFHHFAMV